MVGSVIVGQKGSLLPSPTPASLPVGEGQEVGAVLSREVVR